MARLGHVLKGHEGLESANATLAGDVTLVYDDELTSREALLARPRDAAASASRNPPPERRSTPAGIPPAGSALEQVARVAADERERTDRRRNPPHRGGRT